MRFKTTLLSLAVSMVALSTQAAPMIKSFHPFIVGGVQATSGEFPFMVSLHQGYNGHFCGASLIKPNWILTGAHCMGGGFKAYVGLHDQRNLSRAEEFQVTRVIVHPNYDENTMDYDYALVQLSGNSTKTPIEVNTQRISIPANDSIMVTTAGWGLTSESGWTLPDILNKVDVPLVNSNTCQQAYGNITDRMLCAGFAQGGKDSCQGDSGGPVFMKKADGKFLLLGTVSFGEGCARPNRYGVYTDVTAVTDWISNQVGGL